MTTWFPILGAPSAWALQGLLLWLVASWNCPGGGPILPATYWVSGAALAVALAAFVAAAAAWRRSANRGVAPIWGWTGPDFAAASALLVSGAFVLAVVASAIPTFLLSACDVLR